ncbi:hypothetical protein LAZ67_19002416, partial [Cordylochernes scorpioides]
MIQVMIFMVDRSRRLLLLTRGTGHDNHAWTTPAYTIIHTPGGKSPRLLFTADVTRLCPPPHRNAVFGACRMAAGAAGVHPSFPNFTLWQADLAPKEMAASDMRNRRHVQPLLTWSTNAVHPVSLDQEPLQDPSVYAVKGRGLAFLFKNLYYEDIAVNITNTLDLEAQGIKVYLNQNKAINIYN